MMTIRMPAVVVRSGTCDAQVIMNSGLQLLGSRQGNHDGFRNPGIGYKPEQLIL